MGIRPNIAIGVRKIWDDDELLQNLGSLFDQPIGRLGRVIGLLGISPRVPDHWKP